MNARDVGVVARFEIVRLLKSRHGLLFVGILLLLIFLAGLELRNVATRAEGLQQQLGPEVQKVVFGIVSWWTDLDEAVVKRLLDAHPPILLALFAMVLGLLAPFSMALSFDQTPSDIQGRHIRYLLPRTDRTSLYVGKALACWAVLAGCMALTVGAVAASLVGTKVGVGGAAGLVYLVRVWATLVFFCAPFVAFMACVGAWIGRPFLTLVTGLTFQLGVFVFATMGAMWKEPLSNLAYAFPTAMKYRLVSDQWGDILAAAGHQAGLAALFFLVGLWRFRRRDL